MTNLWVPIMAMRFGQILRQYLERNRKFVPLASTFALFVVIYGMGAVLFEAMRGTQGFFNLFDAAPFLIVCVVGETFVIISGGIDLSVGGILALSTVVAVSLINEGFNPWAAFAIVLAMGMIFGLVQGLLITYLKVQPFIATLAGLWLARGLCYVISDQEVRINDPTYHTLKETKILIPFLGDASNPDPYLRTGPYITYLVVIALIVFLVGLAVLHLTRFGRNVYAIGGGNGANEVSARLMGLPVDRTKVGVYTLSGLCAAMGGILFSIYVNSGHGSHGDMFELTVIAAVVIGGVALTGGEGYMIGALVGVLLTALLQVLLQHANLLSYFTYICIGGLMLLFLLLQSLVATWNAAAIARARTGVRVRKKPTVWYKTTAARYAGVALVTVLAVGTVAFVAAPFVFPKQQLLNCTLKPMREQQSTTLAASDAVIVFERNGGTTCIDELFAVYPDGRVDSDFGDGIVKTTQITTDQLDVALAAIDEYGWFTDEFVTTHHKPCAACYQYSLTVKYKDQTKTVGAVDGGADAPDAYWQIVGKLAGILPMSA
jgi:simple sugar transport system permease protein